MSKTSILLLIIITAIVITLAISTFTIPPGIDSVDISSNKESAFKESPQAHKIFSIDENDIFLTIKTNNLNQNDAIRVFIKSDDSDLFQENMIIIEDNGSALITVPLLKINDQFSPNNYYVEVLLNDQLSHELIFSID